MLKKELKQMIKQVIEQQKYTKIFIDNRPWYLRKIDSTHLQMSTSPGGNGAVYHVAQLKHNQYYTDLVDWLHNKIDISNNTYQDSR